MDVGLPDSCRALVLVLHLKVCVPVCVTFVCVCVWQIGHESERTWHLMPIIKVGVSIFYFFFILLGAIRLSYLLTGVMVCCFSRWLDLALSRDNGCILQDLIKSCLFSWLFAIPNSRHLVFMRQTHTAVKYWWYFSCFDAETNGNSLSINPVGYSNDVGLIFSFDCILVKMPSSWFPKWRWWRPRGWHTHTH